MACLESCLINSDPHSFIERRIHEVMELVETLAKESHLFCYILKCRSCGQLYYYEFFEEIDWIDGKDPQRTIYIPVDSIEEAQMRGKAPPGMAVHGRPYLLYDFPKEASTPKLTWIGHSDK